MSSSNLFLSIFNTGVSVHTDNKTGTLLLRNFGYMQAALDGQPHLRYIVEADRQTGTYTISRAGADASLAENIADLLFYLEKDITIELQKVRRDLYFLHSAALEFNGRACLIAAPSGSGKSTTTWALLHNGFRYLSDELAPVDLEKMEVTPYPHAICLKSDPPAPFVLPDATLRTTATLHVPVEALPGLPVNAAVPLAAVFFLQYAPGAPESTMEPITAAEAGARIYSNTLNLLAHPQGGLDAAIAIARHCRCFNVKSNDLALTCGLIRATMEALSGGNSGEQPTGTN